MIFGTSTLPEYYNDVLKILALPAGYVVTYDYSTRHVSPEIQMLLHNFKLDQTVRAALAYVQPARYRKGLGSDNENVLPDPTIQTFTQLTKVIDVRTIQNNNGVRFYIEAFT